VVQAKPGTDREAEREMIILWIFMWCVFGVTSGYLTMRAGKSAWPGFFLGFVFGILGLAISAVILINAEHKKRQTV
jgi:hypothetical protein